MGQARRQHRKASFADLGNVFLDLLRLIVSDGKAEWNDLTPRTMDDEVDQPYQQVECNVVLLDNYA